MTARVSGLSALKRDYDAVLCDVWGVVHNGAKPWPEAGNALAQFKAEGGVVVMITNSPKPSQLVIEQMETIGVPSKGVFDAVVSSGDTTQGLISEVNGPIFFLGPERDHILLEGLDVTLAQPSEAIAVVCTGMYDDETEKPEDYHELLGELAELNLPFICANPDIIVERGDRMIWCAGALARDYEQMGGEVRIVGKPHKPIYDRAMAKVTEINGHEVSKNRILAIGDGMPTDVKGAKDNGLDFLYVSAGIHAAEYGDPDKPDDGRLQAFLRENDARPVAYLPRLIW